MADYRRCTTSCAPSCWRRGRTRWRRSRRTSCGGTPPPRPPPPGPPAVAAPVPLSLAPRCAYLVDTCANEPLMWPVRTPLMAFGVAGGIYQGSPCTKTHTIWRRPSLRSRAPAAAETQQCPWTWMPQSRSSQLGRRRRLGTARSPRRPRSRRRHSQQPSRGLSSWPSSSRPPSRFVSHDAPPEHRSAEAINCSSLLSLDRGMCSRVKVLRCDNAVCSMQKPHVMLCIHRWRLAQHLQARQPQAASRVRPLRARPSPLLRPASPSSSRSSRLDRQRSSSRRRSSRLCLPRSSQPPGSSRRNRCVSKLHILSLGLLWNR